MLYVSCQVPWLYTSRVVSILARLYSPGATSGKIIRPATPRPFTCFTCCGPTMLNMAPLTTRCDVFMPNTPCHVDSHRTTTTEDVEGSPARAGALILSMVVQPPSKSEVASN